ncbi:hypothetical protein B0H66DRAFT_622659 [Apodospora peruviana]|uniref:DUF2415 domain-containing protein n=1 Tax=Apodospora peruviana TaxID=516989 RepID=A0AAE0I4T5_9PEZI|nr:hypothetical protein B0H66DRAFT_622659 [Apodospora peruviana]
MAVKDDFYHPTEDLILAKPRRHFCTNVHAVHWQLRSLIGAEKDNIVYFPTGHNSLDVQQLNTTTHKTEIIKRLPFQPRCLVAQNGWVCCGGETGEFTAIKVEEEEEQNSADATLNLDLDDIDPSRREEETSILASWVQARTEKSLLARSKKFGKERVNCITLWFPPTLVKRFQGAYDQPVAVLSNNDKTVALVGLNGEQQPLDELCYPDCVNRAVISPDGRLLIAISDDPYLYIHERAEKSSGSSSAFRTADRPVYEWILCRKIHLKSQRKEDRTDSRGSFAACFSSTGRYLAVGTQYGTISIFNAGAFTIADEDPLLTSFNSSRPYAESGAVRDMAFAPGPIDLLAWTEDRGRVGIADLRSGCLVRQILKLDKQDDYEDIAVVDNVRDRGSIDPRLLETRGERNDTLSSSFASTLDLSLESRGSRRSETRDLLERYHGPLGPDETSVLEALQEHRRRREQRAAGQLSGAPGPRLAWPERSIRTTVASENARPRERSASVSRAVNDILGNIRDQRERIRDSQERLRATMRDENERRRPAVPPTAGAAAAAVTTIPGRATTAAAIERNAPVADNTADRRALVSRLIAANTTPAATQSGLENLEALYDYNFHSRQEAPSLFQRSVTGHDADIRRWRATRAAYLMRDWDEPTRRSHGSGFPSRGLVSPDPYDTAGLAWSEDGHYL